MKVEEYEIPEDLLYTREHEWVKIADPTRAIVGITEYAVKQLHEVVYVSLPNVGKEFQQMEVLGTVESIKAVSDIYIPLSGRVTKINEALNLAPERVNQSPFNEGWLVEMMPSNPEERANLLGPKLYAEHIKSLLGL